MFGLMAESKKEPENKGDGPHEAPPAALGENVLRFSPPGSVLLTGPQRGDILRTLDALRSKTNARNLDESLTMRERRENLRKQSRDEAEAIFRLAGFKVTAEWELRNGYWPDEPDYDDVRSPWWLFQTEAGLIEFGRRKHVFSIDWSACQFRGIVTNDDVTKGDSMVHAGTIEKAIEYLQALHQYLV
jgi:hypothetical protein